MKLKLLFTDDKAKLVGVATDTGESIDGVKSTTLNLDEGTVTIVLDIEQVKYGTIKVVYAE